MIEIRDVCFSYTENEPVLDKINISIKSGERVGIIGANGAGKSTLFKALLGLIDVRGDIVIDDISMNRQNLRKIRQKMGIVLQDSDNQMFMPHVIDDMMFGPMNYGMSREDAYNRAVEVLDKLGLNSIKDRHNYRLSGGEKRMAAIATILTMNPQIVLMDEPTASLDPYNRRKIIEVLNDLSITRVIATHDLDMVLETCDRVILMDNGQVIADSDADTILRDKELLETHRLELPFCLSGGR